MRVALDSNVLAYQAGIERHPDDRPKIIAARSLLGRLADEATLVVPVQALGELFNVARKAGASLEEARGIVSDARSRVITPATSSKTLQAALDLAVAHRLQIWDAIILSAAAEAGCAILLSEDMQAGFSAGGVEVVDPFASPPARRLARLLG